MKTTNPTPQKRRNNNCLPVADRIINKNSQRYIGRLTWREFNVLDRIEMDGNPMRAASLAAALGDSDQCIKRKLYAMKKFGIIETTQFTKTAEYETQRKCGRKYNTGRLQEDLIYKHSESGAALYAEALADLDTRAANLGEDDGYIGQKKKTPTQQMLDAIKEHYNATDKTEFLLAKQHRRAAAQHGHKTMHHEGVEIYLTSVLREDWKRGAYMVTVTERAQQ